MHQWGTEDPLATFTHVAVNRGNTFGSRGTPRYIWVGNLIRNGRFENGLAYWKHKNVRIVSGKETHEGRGAAGLGAFRQNLKSAWMFQPVPLPSSDDPLFLQLFFSVAGFRNRPAPLDVTLTWFDVNFAPIGNGLEIRIHRRAIGNGSVGKWSTYTFISSQVPQEADFAVLHFHKRPGVQSKNFLVVDDVLLLPVLSSRLPEENGWYIEGSDLTGSYRKALASTPSELEDSTVE